MCLLSLLASLVCPHSLLDNRSSLLPSSSADLVGCLCHPTHSRHFRRQSSLAVHCPHNRCFDVFVVRQTFCRATEVLCRPSSSLSWSYCCHVSHRTTASRQDPHHCRVAPGGSPCPAHPNMLLWGQLRRCKVRWMCLFKLRKFVKFGRGAREGRFATSAAASSYEIVLSILTWDHTHRGAIRLSFVFAKKC